MARILATLAAALVAALAFTHTPAQAEPPTGVQATVGQPLNLTPTFRRIKQLNHPVAARTLHRSAHRHAAPTAVAMPRNHDGRRASRGPDTAGLIGMLPWWRADPMETIRYLDREAGSGVLAAADAWLAAPGTENQVAATSMGIQHGWPDEASELDVDAEVTVADANDLNAIDLLAVAVAGPRMPDQPWLHAWLAMLAGALAAAATARFLFA